MPLISAAEHIAIARTVLGRGSPFRFTVRGRSMRGAIPDGAAVTIRPIPYDAARSGEIAAFVRKDRIVCHRLIGRSADRRSARGDTSFGTDVIEREDWLGVVEFVHDPHDAAAPPRAMRTVGARWRGRATGIAWMIAAAIIHVIWIRPLGRSLARGGVLRRGTARILGTTARFARTVCGGGSFADRLEAAHAALLNARERESLARPGPSRDPRFRALRAQADADDPRSGECAPGRADHALAKVTAEFYARLPSRAARIAFWQAIDRRLCPGGRVILDAAVNDRTIVDGLEPLLGTTIAEIANRDHTIGDRIIDIGPVHIPETLGDLLREIEAAGWVAVAGGRIFMRRTEAPQSASDESAAASRTASGTGV